MTDKTTQAAAPGSNMEKNPDDWVTGDEPMTGAQRSYLKTLSEQAKVEFDDSLTKAHASQRIEELQRMTGRGTESGGHGSGGQSSGAQSSSAQSSSAQSSGGESSGAQSSSGTSQTGASQTSADAAGDDEPPGPASRQVAGSR